MATYHQDSVPTQAQMPMHFYAGRPAANVGVAVDNGKQAASAPVPAPVPAAAPAPVPAAAAAAAPPAAAASVESMSDVQKQKEELEKQKAAVASMESEITRRSIAQDQKEKM